MTITKKKKGKALVMNMLHELEEFTGEPWTGVALLDESVAGKARSMRLCGAIALSFETPIQLSAEELSCPGARRSLGLERNDHWLVEQMSEKTGLPISLLLRVLKEKPRLEQPAHTVRMGPIGDADVLVGYLPPLATMNLVRLWQCHFGSDLDLHVSGFLAVCSCIAEAASRERLCLSFGCPDSREHGGIPPNKLVAVMSVELARVLMQERTNHAYL